MGNYIFRSDLLWDVLTDDAHHPTDHDFGRTILPALCQKHRVFAYNFLENRVPGLQPYEVPAYWRDVGTIAAYYDAHMDLLGAQPGFDLDNRRWPMFSRSGESPPVRIRSGDVRDSLLAEGCVVDGARIVRSILGRGVKVGPGAVIEDAVLMDHCEIAPGARLHGTIVDRFNRVPGDVHLDRAGTIRVPPDLAVHRDPASGIAVVARAEPYGPLPH
jgi:glucose-1-phosphate adenylyltransferase